MTGNMSAFACFHLYKYMKIQGPRFQRNYIEHHCQRSKSDLYGMSFQSDQKSDLHGMSFQSDQKSDLHGMSFQSLPKINRMLITKTICIQ